MTELRIFLDEGDVELLQQLVGVPSAAHETVPELVEHLARCAAAGVRRPGAWERHWLTQATGWHDGYR